MAGLVLHRSHDFSSPAGELSYLIHEPPGWSEEPRPLLLFLHGAGERGSDINRVAAHGVPREVERGRNLPFVTISPQCPAGRAWGDMTQLLTELLDELIPKVRADERRLYLTGMSMGGFGAWQLAATTPDRFAALVPVCGGGNVDWAPRLRHLPTWAFHGERDEVVPARSTRQMVDALRAQEAPVKLTLYPDLGHDSWTVTYESPELYDWMLGQRRQAERDDSVLDPTRTAT